jgi:peptide-methionine (R)-S-oxide reductase
MRLHSSILNRISDLCAGCQTPLFDGKEKFHSGTGWPSFAAPLMSAADPKVSNVEMEDVSTFQYQLAGAEVRCHSCGGHLGDVFADGFLFVGTPAAITGKRYCIDGAALLFAPREQKSTEELEILRGDLPPKSGQKRVFLG